MRFYSNLTRPNRNLQSLQTLQNDFCCQQLWKKKKFIFLSENNMAGIAGRFLKDLKLTLKVLFARSHDAEGVLKHTLRGKSGYMSVACFDLRNVTF